MRCLEWSAPSDLCRCSSLTMLLHCVWGNNKAVAPHGSLVFVFAAVSAGCVTGRWIESVFSSLISLPTERTRIIEEAWNNLLNLLFSSVLKSLLREAKPMYHVTSQIHILLLSVLFKESTQFQLRLGSCWTYIYMYVHWALHIHTSVFRHVKCSCVTPPSVDK